MYRLFSFFDVLEDVYNLSTSGESDEKTRRIGSLKSDMLDASIHIHLRLYYESYLSISSFYRHCRIINSSVVMCVSH